MDKIGVDANRAQRAASLILHWIDRHLGQKHGGDEQHIQSVKRVKRLAQASLCSASGIYPMTDKSQGLNGEVWHHMICLNYVHEKALLDGVGSDAHQWLSELTQFQWGSVDQPQSDQTMEHHGYHQMLLYHLIVPAWSLAGVYCEEHQWSELGESFVKNLKLNPFEEHIEWLDIENINARNRAQIEREKLKADVIPELPKMASSIRVSKSL